MMDAAYIVSVGFALVLGILANGRYAKMSGRETSFIKTAVLSIIPIVNLFFIALSLSVLAVSEDTFNEALDKREEN